MSSCLQVVQWTPGFQPSWAVTNVGGLWGCSHLGAISAPVILHPYSFKKKKLNKTQVTSFGRKHPYPSNHPASLCSILFYEPLGFAVICLCMSVITLWKDIQWSQSFEISLWSLKKTCLLFSSRILLKMHFHCQLLIKLTLLCASRWWWGLEFRHLEGRCCFWCMVSQCDSHGLVDRVRDPSPVAPAFAFLLCLIMCWEQQNMQLKKTRSSA